MDEMSATDRARLIEWLRNLPFFLPAQPRRVGGVSIVTSPKHLMFSGLSLSATTYQHGRVPACGSWKPKASACVLRIFPCRNRNCNRRLPLCRSR